MSLDAICLRAVINEIAPQVEGCRIEKVQQPARDQIILLLRGSRRLLLCANPNQPRIHLTEELRDNPSQPPMFCMLLRKYIGNGRILALEQAPLERVVTLHIEATDEMGEQSRFALILEAMGRRANLILCDKDGRILDCLRRVDLEMSQERQLLPGLFYHLPADIGKRSPLEVGAEEFAALAANRGETQADEWLVQTFTAISPLVAREIVSRAGTDDGNALWRAFAAWQKEINESTFTPTMLQRNGKPTDFSYLPIRQYGAYAETIVYDGFCAMLDSFYREREQAERVKQKGQDLIKTATTARDRVRRRLAMQEKDYAKTQERDQLRIFGELITANFYRMERGQSSLRAQNYYEDGCPDMVISLDARLSPQENAARYFKQYAKAKTAEKMLRELMEKGREELRYLESVLQELQLSESEQDFNDIRTELTEGGYLRRGGSKKQMGFQRTSKPRVFRSTAGFRILVGRNNRQNDRLTAKDADKRDLWLHTQKIHGSHVILCTDGGEADEQSIREAASLAAYFSQGREGGKIPVDYTPVRYVKKPASARPGMVVYTTYKTLMAEADAELVKRLQEKA